MKDQLPKRQWEIANEIVDYTGDLDFSSREQQLSALAQRKINADRGYSAAMQAATQRGMDIDLIQRALKTADEAAINELSEILFEEIVHHSLLTDKGETHINSRTDVIPESLIKFLSGELLNKCFSLEISPNLFLVNAIRELLGVPRYGSKAVGEVHRKKVAILLFASNPKISISAVAKELNIDKTSVSRWRKEEDFQQQISRLRSNAEALEHWNRLHEQGLPLPD